MYRRCSKIKSKPTILIDFHLQFGITKKKYLKKNIVNKCYKDIYKKNH